MASDGTDALPAAVLLGVTAPAQTDVDVDTKKEDASPAPQQSKDETAAEAPIQPLEPQRPVIVSEALPVSSPLPLEAELVLPRSRRNSWVDVQAVKEAAAAAETTVVLPSEVSKVEPLAPHHTAMSPVAAADAAQMQVDGVQEQERGVPEARATVPRPVPRSYHPTPVSSPRRLAAAAATTNVDPSGASSTFDFFSGSFGDFAPGSSSSSTSSASASSSSHSRVSHLAPLVPSPLVNLLLLGDDSCGLGVALDEFAGRDQNVGITFKTRRIKLPPLPGTAPAPGTMGNMSRRGSRSRAGSKDGAGIAVPDAISEDASVASGDEFRVRCWHTPGVTPETVRSLAPYLRNVQAVALIYDSSSLASFAACERWVAVLEAHHQSQQEQGVAGKQRPVLLIGNTAQQVKAQMQQQQVQQVAAEAVAEAKDATRPSHAGADYSGAVVPAHGTEQAAGSTHSPVPPPNPSSRSSSRRSSLSHVHPAHPASGLVSFYAVAATTGAEGAGGNVNSAAALPSGQPFPDRPVTERDEATLLQRLQASSSGFACASSMRINANLWKERYRAFQRVAAMVQQMGAVSMHSRPVSPVPMQHHTA